jgi:hypothetical protein
VEHFIKDELYNAWTVATVHEVGTIQRPTANKANGLQRKWISTANENINNLILRLDLRNRDQVKSIISLPYEKSTFQFM